MQCEFINVAFTFNYYEFNTSDTKTFKACFKRFDLKNKNSIIKFELL